MRVSLKTCTQQFAICYALTFGLNADPIPQGWAADNIKPIGYSGLDGRGGAFKMAIKRVNDRWFMFLGHLWHSGWTILDVTDPANPKFLKFVEGPANTNTIQMEFHDNIMVTALQRRPPNWGGHPNEPNDEGVLIWDISDPVNWKLLSHWKTNANGIHRIGYPGGKYFNAAATMPGGFRRHQRSQESERGRPLVDAGSERRRRARAARHLIPRAGDGHGRRQEGLPRLWSDGCHPRHQ